MQREDAGVVRVILPISIEDATPLGWPLCLPLRQTLVHPHRFRVVVKKNLVLSLADLVVKPLDVVGPRYDVGSVSVDCSGGAGLSGEEDSVCVGKLFGD